MTPAVTILARTTHKTVDLTSTMRKMATMTTKKEFGISSNIFIKNEIFNLKINHGDSNPELSGALSLHRLTPLTLAHAAAMKKLYDRVIGLYPTHELWLLVSNGGMVESNRIIEFFGLWKGLKKNGIILPEGIRSEEFQLREGNNIQFFGSVQILNPDFSQIAYLLKLRPKFHLLISSDEGSIKNLLENGWKYRGHKCPFELLPTSESDKNILILPVGEFDDPEGGAIALAKPKVIRQIFN
jgi:hypothetical protein